MYRLVESIKVNDGVFHNLVYHDRRLRRSMHELFGAEPGFDLATVLRASDVPPSGLFKCRFLYDPSGYQIEYTPYSMRGIKTLKIVYLERADYSHKYTDRKILDEALAAKAGCDDVIIIRRGLVTDASSANVAFRRKGAWFVPDSFLLPGTIRQKLIDQGAVRETTIGVEDIRDYDACKLINAMVEFDMPEISVANIVF